MTKAEFLVKAMLKIAGNSAFGNDYQGGYYSIDAWARKIKDAAYALLDAAENDCMISDEYFKEYFED